MPPKPRQLHAPQPKQSGNAFQALVDLPNDGSDSTFDGRDGIVDGIDDNIIVIMNLCDSRPPASQQLQHNEWVEDNIILLSKQLNDSEAMYYKIQ
jgi:tetrahydromethanopterin S-methyltransferase subunit G